MIKKKIFVATALDDDKRQRLFNELLKGDEYELSESTIDADFVICDLTYPPAFGSAELEDRSNKEGVELDPHDSIPWFFYEPEKTMCFLCWKDAVDYPEDQGGYVQFADNKEWFCPDHFKGAQTFSNLNSNNARVNLQTQFNEYPERDKNQEIKQEIDKVKRADIMKRARDCLHVNPRVTASLLELQNELEWFHAMLPFSKHSGDDMKEGSNFYLQNEKRRK